MVVRRGIIAVGLTWALIASFLVAIAPSSDAATRRFVGGWIPYWSTEQNLQAFRANAAIFSDVSPFWHSLTGDTTVSDQEGAGDRRAVIGAARDAGVPVIPAITDGMGKGRLAAALADPARRSTVVRTMVSLVESRGYDGLDLDLEGFAYTDGRSTWPSTRPNWVAFVTELGQQLRSRGKALHVTIPPTYDSLRTTTSGYWVYDYAGIAPHVDRVRLMAYDYSVSRAGPIAPYDWVQRVVRYAVTKIPANKVVLGIPTYGRDWVTNVAGSCPEGTSLSRRSLTAADAWGVAKEKGATVRWDAGTRERTFTYTERFASGDASCSVARTVWFVDGAAVSERARLYSEYGLRGVALWTVGGADATSWQALRSLSAGQGYPLTAGQVLEVPVAGGSSGVPADAAAVSLNVTVTAPRSPGYLGVFPCGSSWPGTSNVNFTAGQTIADNVLVGVGTGGKVCVYTSTTAHVVVDISGHFPAGSAFQPRRPVRLTDTRSGPKPAAGGDVAVTVPAGISAAALSIAVTQPDGSGWVSAYPCGSAWPGTSTVNFRAGQTIAAGAVAEPGSNGKVCLRTSARAHLVVDLMGVFESRNGFTPLRPARITDTRITPGTRVPAMTEYAVSPGVAGSAVGLNVTVTGAGGPGWAQAYPCGVRPPTTSTVNYAAGQTIANAALVKVGSNGKVCLRSSAATHFVIDRTASFPDSGTFVAATPKRLADTRIP